MTPLQAASASAPRIFTRRLLQALLLATLLVLVVFALGWLYTELLTIFAGTLLGVFLHGVAMEIARRTGWEYRAVVGSLVVLLLVLIALAIWRVGPALASQVEQLVTEVPAALRVLQTELRRVPFLRFFAPNTTGGAGNVVFEAASLVRRSVEAVAEVVIMIVIGIYGAFDPGVYERALVRLVPIPRRARAVQVLERLGTTLVRWVVGRIIVMVIVGVLTAVGLWVAGVPIAFALGLLAGVMTFIPYLGTLLSMIPAMLVGLTKSPWDVLWVLVVFAVAHGLEGYVLAPLIARRTVEFPPAFTISVQILLGAVWGILGFAFATPIAVVATILVEMLYIEDSLGDRPHAVA